MTGWPDKDRPGVPLNPDRDGWHWLEGATGTPAALEWRASVLKPDIRGWYLHRAQYGVLSAQEMARWTYLGPCLTPEEVQAKDARIAELEAVLQRIASAGGLFAEPASGQHAREIARAALGGKDG